MKVGFIGGNDFTKNLCRSFKTSGFSCEFRFIEEDIVASRNIIKEFKHLTYHSDKQTFLSNLDYIVICSNHKALNDLAIQAAKEGKHIILADPFLVPMQTIRKLRQLEEEAGIKIQNLATEQYNPTFQRALTYIKDPVFIDVARLTNYTSDRTLSSVLFKLLYKDLEWVISLLNCNIRKVSANSLSVTGDEIDFINAKLEFENGCIANLTASRVSELELKKARIYNSNSVVYADFLNNRLKYSYKNSKILNFEEINIPEKSDFSYQIEDLKSGINNGKELSANLNKFIKTIEVMELIIEKIKAKTTNSFF